MDSVLNAIRNRRSTRSFTEELPSRELVHKILEAGSWAPSGKGLMQWHFTVLYGSSRTMELAKLVEQEDNRPGYCFYGAPVHILVSFPAESPYGDLDGSAAMQNMMLAAEALGLGTCWINQIRNLTNNAAIRAKLTEFGVPSDNRVIASIALGYIAKETPVKPRPEMTNWVE